jgi:hypothetical protein
MQADLLAQLRDIHLPIDPDWWPPAPGWWILALIVLAALAYGGYRLVVRWRRFRPARQAQALYLKLHASYVEGRIPSDTYLHLSNELLKRFVIFGVGDTTVKPESGERWLEYLDQRSGTTAFSDGPGRWLGNDRFRRQVATGLDDLHDHLKRFFQQERASFWSLK